MLDEIVRGTGGWVDQLTEIGLPASTTSRLARLMETRMGELGALSST